MLDSLEALYGETLIKNFPKVIQHIAVYIDKGSEVLQTKDVSKHLLYTQSIENALYDAAGVDKAEIIKLIKECEDIDQKIQDQVMPIYNFLMILSCIYEKYNEYLKKMYKFKGEPGHYVRFYLALRLYSICQRQIFIHEARSDIMEYTIQNLSNRYDISKYTNIYNWLYDYMITNNSALNIDFTKIRNTEIYAWNSKYITRVKSNLKYIFKEFWNNYENNKTIIEESIHVTNKEGDDYYAVTTSVSNQIEIYSKNVQQQFIQDKEVRDNLVAIACKNNHCSASKLKYILTELKDDPNDNKLLMAVIMDLISFWIISGKQKVENIHSMTFIKRCIGAYSISNTYDPFIISLKQHLAQIVEKYGQKYVDIDKKTTVNNFKQSLFLYMVFYISSVQ